MAALSVAAAGAVLAIAERDAGAQRMAVTPAKPLFIKGVDNTHQPIDTTAGAIQSIEVTAHAAGGATLEIDGVAGKCFMSLPSASDAAAMQARLLDPKGTAVTCQGPVTTIPNNFIPSHTISAATDVTVSGVP
jgi:hypothetical protein